MEIIEGLDQKETCPSDHPVHSDCLQQWLLHAKTCPLCSNAYSDDLIKKYQDFVDKTEQSKLDAYKEKQQQETLKKIEVIAEKIVFLKFVEFVEKLAEEKRFDEALDRLAPHESDNLMTFKAQKTLFLKGKLNYLKGRFDLAINFLFRLVKEKFDFPDGFLYLGRAYEQLGLTDKARWAYERVK